jgi:hypothetical protein
MRFMHLKVIAFLALLTLPLSAQTLYVPSGTSGISSSSTGNVGIGTSAPQRTLDVSNQGQITFGNDVVTNSTNGLYWHAGSTYGIYRTSGSWSAPDYQQLKLYFDTGIILDGGYAYGKSGVILQPNGGNVGIGTTTPASALAVLASVNNAIPSLSAAPGGSAIFGNTGTTAILSAGVDNAAHAWLQSRGSDAAGASYALLLNPLGGNVGIGTTTPGAKLEINSTANPNGIENVLTLTGGNAAEAGPAIVFKPYFSGSYPTWKVGSISIGYAGHLGYDGAMHFSLNSTAGTPTDLTERMTIVGSTGNVGIGTTSPTQKLAVNGTIRAKEVIVDTGWSDYVFDESYKLKALSEVEAYVKTEKHLPGIPSAQEVAEHGVTVGEMQSKLLAKVEELTLHLIRIEKENAALRKEMDLLKHATNQ